jgi:hypothetical protein
MGVGPEYLARQLSESGQIGTAVTEVLRGKAATLVAERVKVSDEAGHEIDVKSEIEALNADVDSALAAQAAAGEEQSDIDVDDLAVDVAGTIEGQADVDEADDDEDEADDEDDEDEADDDAEDDEDDDEA